MSMIVRIFSEHASVEAARQAVLDAGLSPDCIALSFQGDEAGALCGNFLSGDYEPGGEIAETYERKFRNVVIGGKFVLTVEASPEQVGVAEAVLAAAGGSVVDDLSPPPK
ncbi:hypothetical protein [Ralstonia pseudosolanacearum]|uniref:Uncharacterized protein n=1 Tax=Ralstonia solanacearum TaxID=305 RepID=A0AA86IKL0_RALSL|nr:hypothetical protein [Ralstonia pseudosolanacearum]AYA48254.1 hypothetical protein RSP824_17275 [Ralstonia pseudosolanacearum]